MSKKQTKAEKQAKAEKQTKAEKQKKDPSIAALISVVGLFLLSPAIGYFYIGEVRKGIVYLIATWVVAAISAGVYFVGSAATFGFGGVCCLPVFLLAFIFGLLVVYDVYLMASGQPAKLPEI